MTQSPKAKPLPKQVVKPTPITIPTTPTPAPIPIDSTLKVAQCQAAARIQSNKTVDDLLASELPKFQQQLDDAHGKTMKAQQDQINYANQAMAGLVGYSPSAIQNAYDSAFASMQPTVDYYKKLENQIADNWDAAKSYIKQKGEEFYNIAYSSCLNK